MNKCKMGRVIPKFAYIPLLCVVMYNFGVYSGARFLTKNSYHFNMETLLDDLIPFYSWMVVVYIGCYIFWIANYILVSHISREHAMRFYMADIIAKTVCFLTYITFPTTMNRYDIIGDGFAEHVVKILYSIDAADNLFPSIHCLVSWLCYIGVRGQKKMPIWYQRLSCVIAIMVCVSTVTIKQHVLWDVVAGVCLAEIAYMVAHKVEILKNSLMIKESNKYTEF